MPIKKTAKKAEMIVPLETPIAVMNVFLVVLVEAAVLEAAVLVAAAVLVVAAVLVAPEALE